MNKERLEEMNECRKISINDLVDQAHSNAVKHGWWDGEPRTFGELIALCHSELSEALEEYRKDVSPSKTYVSCGLASDGHCVSSDSDGKFCETGRCCQYAKPEGIPAELSDVLIRIFDMAGHYGIDLDKAIQEKMAYNISRPYRHGGKAI